MSCKECQQLSLTGIRDLESWGILCSNKGSWDGYCAQSCPHLVLQILEEYEDEMGLYSLPVFYSHARAPWLPNIKFTYCARVLTGLGTAFR